jgi:hypothetical protein
MLIGMHSWQEDTAVAGEGYLGMDLRHRVTCSFDMHRSLLEHLQTVYGGACVFERLGYICLVYVDWVG